MDRVRATLHGRIVRDYRKARFTIRPGDPHHLVALMPRPKRDPPSVATTRRNLVAVNDAANHLAESRSRREKWAVAKRVGKLLPTYA